MIDDEKPISWNPPLSKEAHLVSRERQAMRQALVIGLVGLVAAVVIGLLHPAAPVMMASAPLESGMLVGD